MPRPNRCDFPGARHHVMNRGASRDAVFRGDGDAAGFLECLRDASDRFGLRVHAFALMPTHFHLMVVSEHGRLSDAMSYLQGRYRRVVREQQGPDDPLWRSRFSNRVIEDGDHWRYLLAYLHLAPVRAHLAASPDQARWTSHGAYTSGTTPPTWLDTTELLERLGGPDGVERFVRDVHDKTIDAPPGFSPSHPLRLPKNRSRTPPRTQRKATRTVEQAIEDVCKVTGLARDELFRYRRGRPGNRAAWIAAWWLQRVTGARQVQVAAVMGLAQPGVAQRIAQLQRALRSGDPELTAWQAALLARD